MLSPGTYNGKVGLAIFCPITNQKKGYIFEVEIPDGEDVTGVILSDQVKSLDWRRRNAKKKGRLPEEIVEDVLAKIAALLNPTE